MQTSGIVKTSGCTRCVCKNRGFIKFKGFLVEFSQSSSENQSPPPRLLVPELTLSDIAEISRGQTRGAKTAQTPQNVYIKEKVNSIILFGADLTPNISTGNTGRLYF